MSRSEEACRWRIANAYLAWSLADRVTFAWLAYCRALGLEFDVPAAAEGGTDG